MTQQRRAIRMFEHSEYYGTARATRSRKTLTFRKPFEFYLQFQRSRGSPICHVGGLPLRPYTQ